MAAVQEQVHYRLGVAADQASENYLPAREAAELSQAPAEQGPALFQVAMEREGVNWQNLTQHLPHQYFRLCCSIPALRVQPGNG